jgi:signal transduction histidine kinase/DNA-binding response OmpR family regulator/CHASE3 domain sensor protein
MRWLRSWPDLSLRAKCLLLISFPAAATVLMAGAANILAVRNSAASEQVTRALRVGQEIQRLRASDSETSSQLRAYFITTQESFAGHARASLRSFDSARQKLLNLTADAPWQQQRLAQIAVLDQAREERLFGGVARFRSGDLAWGELRTLLQGGEAEQGQMEEQFRKMEQDNSRQLDVYFGRVNALHRQQTVITGICLIFGLLGGATMTLLFARGITSRIQQLRWNTDRLAAGAPLDPLSGHDEIGSLNGGLLRVAEVLRRKGVALENTLHGIAEVDASGRYLWLNKAYAEMAGCSQIYRPVNLTATVQPEDRARVQDAIAQMRLNGRAEIAARIDQPHGPAPDVSITLLASAEDPESSFYIFLRDLWAGKRGDAALVRAKDAAVASNRAKTDFLAKISHDIRTPLNAILGAADLLSQTALSFDQGEYVNMFKRNCRRLVALINDFLDFSRIEAGAVRVERTPFAVRETVDDAMDTFRESAARKGIALGLEMDPAAPAWILGDALRIQQVLVNLLSNALKFTNAGRVDVKIKVLSASASNKLRFEVCDTGPGIRLEDQDKIFGQFVQLPNQTNGQRGTGLGLTICRDLVELMGGEIGIVSREGVGSTFHFNLPLEAVEPKMAEPFPQDVAPAELPANRIIRILVAEDTDDNRLLLEHYLRDAPVKLRFASNGQEAVDAIQQGELFDLVLMDIDMPVMDGYTATRSIRSWQQSQGIATPIVALSADAMQEAVLASLDAGCLAHVAKPVDRDTLLKTIRRYVPAMADRPVALTPGALPPLALSAPAGSPARTSTVSKEVLELVPQYLASKEKQIEEARTNLAIRDFGPIRRFGHNLKGTGRGYGFPSIEELGKELEKAAQQADASRVAEQLDALHRFVGESAAAALQPVSGQADEHRLSSQK